MRYSVIYSDPPWSYDDKCVAGERGAFFKYPLMTDEEIYSLPVADIAADDCVLFLWATFPKLAEALETIRRWGFTYKTCAFVWIKKNKKQWWTNFWGMGRWTRSNSEICLLAVKGKPKRVSARVHQVIEAPIAEHSRKPAIVRKKIVELCGDVPRLEMFARQSTPGWDVFGNQIEGSIALGESSEPSASPPTIPATEQLRLSLNVPD